MERALVLLAAPDGILTGARDALRDLSAVGLVDEFLWVRLGHSDLESANDQLAIGAVRISAGAAYPVTVQQVLAARQYDRVRVCSLVPVLDSGTSPEPVEGRRFDKLSERSTAESERELIDLVRRSSGTTKIERLRCVITRPGGTARAEELGRDGWHTVVISPEDARGPGLGHQVLEPTDDPAEIGGHAATAVAGLTGLWAGLPEAPLDDVGVAPGLTVRVGRGFFRSLDASAVQQAIREGVASVSGGLPAVRVAGTQSLRIGSPPRQDGARARQDDVDAATGAAADALWRKHAQVLRGPRVQPAPSPVKDIGAFAALRMLFSFIWAAIKNTPMRWRAAITNKIASTTASAVHGSVFGRAPSAYAVVVRGIRPDGTGADWRDWARASNELAGLIGENGMGRGDQGRTEPFVGRHDLSAVWQDYLAGAFTLADGGERVAELPPLQLGADRATLADPGDIIPGPEQRWKVPGGVEQRGTTPFGSPARSADGLADQADLAPYDALGVRAVQDRLNPPEGQLTPELDRARARLDGWLGRFRSGYAAKVGGRLGRAVSDAREEAQTILSQLAHAGTEDEPSDDLRRRMKRLTWWMRGLLIGAAAVIVILALLGGFEALTAATVTIAIIATIVLWLLGSFAVFFVSQRELFRELNRRSEAASQADANRVNLGHVLRDLNRLTAAYEQFLAWSRIGGVVLAAPFGGPVSADRSRALPAAGLPLAARVGVAELRPDAVAQAAAVIRREVFRSGWLSRPWQALLESGPGRLGPDAIDLAENPDRIYAEQAGEDSLLVRWAGLLESDLLAADDQGQRGDQLHEGGRALWQAVGRSLPDSELGRSLVAEVLLAGAKPEPRAYGDFMAGLDQAPEQGPPEQWAPEQWPPEQWNGQQFDPVGFGAEARVAGRQRIVTHWFRTRGDELSRAVVLFQLSEAFPAYELAAVPGASARSTPQGALAHTPHTPESYPVPDVDEVF